MWPPFSSPSAFRLSSSDLQTTLTYSRPDVSATTKTPLGHLTLLVFEAILEVVCVSLPGYIIARQGMFDADAQKFVANLNVQLFTPCLIFTKLAAQLTAEKLVELAIIPFIFVTQIAVSYMCSVCITRLFRFSKRPRNFVVAMGVFGNSNSLPISLVLSLSKTISGLHWDRIPGDNDNEVAARGILYLLIFQQLGQLLRWSWGYHVLLAPPSKYDEDQDSNDRLEDGYRDEPIPVDQTPTPVLGQSQDTMNKSHSPSQLDSDYDSGALTPVTRQHYTHSIASSSSLNPEQGLDGRPNRGLLDGALVSPAADHVTSFPHPGPLSSEAEEVPEGPKGWVKAMKLAFKRWAGLAKKAAADGWRTFFASLPASVQRVLEKASLLVARIFGGLWELMNPPLWAMLAAILVASVPSLQRVFFTPGTFINNSVTRAVAQSGGVAVPLILVVLGANLARNTQSDEVRASSEEQTNEERNLLVAALISRMLLPTLIMAPILALTAKYVSISILDDPIFVIVCFLLTGAPSALQLAQICQINNVYTGVMSKLLFQSYVIWILPSTLALVIMALKVVDWAVE